MVDIGLDSNKPFTKLNKLITRNRVITKLTLAVAIKTKGEVFRLLKRMWL